MSTGKRGECGGGVRVTHGPDKKQAKRPLCKLCAERLGKEQALRQFSKEEQGLGEASVCMDQKEGMTLWGISRQRCVDPCKT